MPLFAYPTRNVSMPDAGKITQLLNNYADGDKAVLDEMLPLVYDELRRIAANYLTRERSGHTLQPTALVHEAYVRLVSQRGANWRNRAQFYGLAANMMRRILVNHAVAKKAEKRGPGGKVPLDDVTLFFEERSLDLLALDEALTRLSELDAEKSQIVELKFFGGLTTAEIADFTGRSARTVERDWNFARSWLYCELAADQQV
jgi:RNA polymerase sigma factor (TIGR02999 family)